MSSLLALTHFPSPRLHAGERTFVAGESIDLALAREQHAKYCLALQQLQVDVRRLEVNGELPDAVFIEDTAVVLDEVAVLACMGAASRRLETAGIATVLREYREVVPLEQGTLEGGDVLAIGRTLLVGRSCRTSSEGIESLARIASRLGYQVIDVPVERCLHLKTACTAVPDGRLLVNPQWLDIRHVRSLGFHWIDAGEPWGANVLCVGETVVLPAAHERTAALLENAGYQVVQVDISELAKAEGGVTCLSLVYRNTE
jgi:dimethylargininase